MNPRELLNKSERLVKENTTVILTAIGVSGTITTGYLAAKGGYEHAKYVTNEFGEQQYVPLKESIKQHWRFYIPAAVSGTLTIVCIVGATRIGNRKAAALTAAYTVSERAFAEYKDKVVEKFGKGKEQQVRDEIAQDRIRNTAPSAEVVLAGSGTVLCCEGYTGRYFNSDMETLRRSQNDINAKLVRHTFAYLSDFHEMIGLPYVTNSNYFGWEADKLMELEFSAAMTSDGRPCLSFEYNYIKPL